MRRILLIVALVLVCVPAIEAQEPQLVEARIFQVKHADVQALAGMLRVFNVGINYNAELKTISVSGTPETLVAIEETIARFDVPPEPRKNVVLTFHMLRASKEEGTPETLPEELRGVAEQLKSLFNYSGLYLMDTSVLRLRDGTDGGVTGAVSYPRTQADHPANYNLNLRQMDLTLDEEAVVVRLDRLQLLFRVPYRESSWSNELGIEQREWRSREVSITTDIDIRESQKVVVGKASLDAQGNHLILVVTAEVVD